MRRLLLAAGVLAAISRAAESASLSAISVDGPRVVLDLSAPVPYQAEFDAKGPRIVIDLNGAQNKLIGVPEAKSSFVRRVAAGGTGGKPNNTRVVIDLLKSAVFDVSWQGSAMIVWLGDFGEGEAPAPPSQAAAQSPRAAPAAPPRRALPVPAKVNPASPARYVVQVAAFRQEGQAAELKDTLELEPSFSPVRISTKEVSGKTYYLVQIGPFDNKTLAKEAVTKLAASGRKALILTSR